MAVEPNPVRTAPAEGSVRYLRVAGEIAHALLTAERPNEVYRVALERVAPLVNASFGCVFLRSDDEEDLLRIVSAYNWPQRYANYLGTMRILIGNGPTGRAVHDEALVEVHDVFADPEVSDWWDPARELRFKSAIAIPLIFGHRPVGALTFYFRDVEAYHAADRNLLQLVASQLAATAEKAHLIEDLQRANEQLREQNEALEVRYREAAEAQKLKSELLANVSHELRTPLTAILGYAYLLKEGVSGPLEVDQMATVNKIETAGRQLVTLVDGLFDLTNLRLGRIEAEPQLCDAVTLARTALAAAAEPAEGVELLGELPGEKIPIHTDPQLVGRVLDGLISNALKFTKEGSVTLRVEPVEPAEEREAFSRGGDVIWEVVDTGIGIGTEDQEFIFEEFRQADGSATRHYGGAGLGLAIARGLAERLGGTVEVESTLGEGAAFRLKLPTSVVQAGRS